MAALIASSAKTEQCILTGGRANSSTISMLSISSASSTDLPLSHSVANEDEAMAEPQPKVLNFASSILPVSFDLQAFARRMREMVYCDREENLEYDEKAVISSPGNSKR